MRFFLEAAGEPSEGQRIVSIGPIVAVPGMAELMRQEGMRSTPRAALSRALVGVRNQTLIINLPGSVKGVRESLRAIAPILSHALEVVSGNTVRCGG